MKFIKYFGFAFLISAFCTPVSAEKLEINPLSINPLPVEPGMNEELVMEYNTEESYIGFEFELTLPEGVSFVMNPDDDTEVDIAVTNPELTKTHTLAAKLHTDGVYKAVFFSMKNSVIKSGSWLLKIPIIVSESFAGRGVGTLQGCRYATSLHEDQYLTTDYFDIYVAPTSIKLSPKALNLKLEETAELAVEYLPESAVALPLIWSSSDETVASVDENGIVKGVSEGVAKITVSLADNSEIMDTCEVAVARLTDIESIFDEVPEVDVYDVNGGIVLQGASIQDVNKLSSGIYIVNGNKVMIR